MFHSVPQNQYQKDIEHNPFILYSVSAERHSTLTYLLMTDTATLTKMLENSKKPNLTRIGLEKFLKNLIKENGLTFYGETISPFIQNVNCETQFNETVKVITFVDEGMEAFIAGDVASSVYNKYEEYLREHGYEPYDSDGTTLYLQRIK